MQWCRASCRACPEEVSAIQPGTASQSRVCHTCVLAGVFSPKEGESFFFFFYHH